MSFLALRIVGVISVAAFAGTLSGQTPPSPEPHPGQAVPVATSAASPAAGAVDSVLLRAGTTVDLALRAAVSSERSKVGDAVDFEVILPVKVGDLVVIAAGTTGTAKVVTAKRRGHKGAAGVLAIAFDGVRLVTGDLATLSAAGWTGVDKRDEVMGDVIAAPLLSFGSGIALAPFILLQRGEGVSFEEGKRLRAVIASDVAVAPDALADRQPRPLTDVAVVYLFNAWIPTCGSVALPFGVVNTRVVRLDLPPGQYWFHAGGYRREVLKSPLSEFAALSAEPGQTYYLEAYDEGTSGKQRIRRLVPGDGDLLLAAPWAPYHRLPTPSPEMLRGLRAEPESLPGKQ